MAHGKMKEASAEKGATEKRGGVAAFFDLDGTLVPLPSLEKRFFAMLRYRRLIGIRNYLLWLREAVRLLPQGINQIMHANKMHLRGVSVNKRDLLTGPSFYPEAIERSAWHAARGHLIVIVSGTLEPLAARAARGLEAELGERGLATKIRVCATRLEEKNEKWTGRILAEAMFGEAKARAVRRIAAAEGLDLQRCFACGDSSSDKWMLEAVGEPAAVNPSNDLARIARRNEWAVLRWGKEKTFAQRPQRTQRSQKTEQTGEGVSGERAKSGYGA